MSGNEHDDEMGDHGGTHTLIRPEDDLKEPSMFRVILLNDDFTPMDFVVLILTKFFKRSTEEATKIMLAVHNKGQGTAGVYTHEIAETKVYLVNDFARKNKHPLKCVMEQD